MATIEFNPTTLFFLGTGWAALWAGLGWWANHKLSTVRDRRTRKYSLEDARTERQRNFCGFMSGFRSWVERGSYDDVRVGWTEKLHPFCEEIARIRGDIPKDNLAQFNVAATNLSKLSDVEVARYKKESEIKNSTNHLAEMIALIAGLAE